MENKLGITQKDINLFNKEFLSRTNLSKAIIFGSIHFENPFWDIPFDEIPLHINSSDIIRPSCYGYSTALLQWRLKIGK